MNKNILLAGAALSVVPSLVAAKAPQKRVQPKQPNIIFILCDDMGYGDLACYGQPYISTPNIDRMAEEGMRFTQAYAGSPVSAPSRASIMTGQHSGHGHVRGNREYWSNDRTVMYGNNVDFAVVGQEPYDPQHKILPEMLKDHGYTTGVFGKWAGGYEGSPSTPDKRGVDEFYGYICQFQAHLYYPNFLNRYSRSMGDTAVVREVMEQNIQYPMFGRDYHKRQQYSARIIHEKALEWIDRQDGKQPFVGFLTYTLPHAELAQPYDSIVEGYEKKFFVDKTWGGQEGSRYNAVEHTHAQFAGMITRLDQYVGEVMAKLREKGLDKNTLVIFTSDNGPHEEGGADPEFFGRDGKLRGTQASVLRGRHTHSVHSMVARTREGRRGERPAVRLLRPHAYVLRPRRREELPQALHQPQARGRWLRRTFNCSDTSRRQFQAAAARTPLLGVPRDRPDSCASWRLEADSGEGQATPVQPRHRLARG